MGPIYDRRLETHRHRLGLTQEKLAEELSNLAWERHRKQVGLDATTISKWERRSRQPSGYYQYLLAQFYETTPEDLGFSRDRSDSPRIDGVALVGSAAPQLVAPFASNAARDRACMQWLAWEMWQRGSYSLHASELPGPVAHHLGALATNGSSCTLLLDGIVLRDKEGCYSFVHKSFVDFFIAQRIFGSIRAGEGNLFASAQTSHETDLVIREFVRGQEDMVGLLMGWMREGASAVLRVNSAGVLAKLGATGLSDSVINVLKKDADTRQLYLTAVASRVLAIPWDQASHLVASVESDSTALSSHLPTDYAAQIATRFASETRNPYDSAARWCSIVLLSQVQPAAPATVSIALQQVLSEEPCQENLRAIGRALAGSNPISS